MIQIESMAATECNDTELVMASLAGRREAFGQIVERYQSLICSLAYCATGSLSQSEDLAQETFVAAWRQLSELREPGKLRAWLCGIVRFRIGKALRRDGCEPSHAAEQLEVAYEFIGTEPLPTEQAISREEEAILWRSLEKIPEAYREPLVLFYREHQSVENVAATLELSEDAVKQRLSRGRRLLQEQVAAFVEGALRQTAPGRSFTLGVMAVLPMQMAGLGTASAGVAAAKAGASTKGGVLLAATTVFAGLFAGFVSTYLGYKMSMEAATSKEERGFIKRYFGLLTGFVLVPVVILQLAFLKRSLAVSHPGLFAGTMIAVVTGWIPAVALFLAWTRRRLGELNGAVPTSATNPSGLSSTPMFEYRSQACLLGLPLIHIRLGATWTSQREPVKAWFAAADDLAVGVIFAFGGMAVAPVCVGGFALGGIVFGGFGVGVLCYAGFAAGIWALGGFAFGLMAIGGCAAGWTAATGGVAIAREFALGGVALAAHANDEVAKAFISNSAFFQNSILLLTKWLWPTLLLSLVPVLLIRRATKKRRKPAT